MVANKLSDVLLAVIVYNPSNNQLANIQKLAKLDCELCVFLNSPISENSLERVKLLGHQVNVGVGAAYNEIFKYAREKNKKFVLLLDQDTNYVEDGALLDKLENLLIEFYKNERLGAIGMRFRPNQVNDQVTPYILTSGTLYKTDAMFEVNGFRDDLFIDEVDIQAHMQLILHGYFVLSKSDYTMKHTVGDPIKFRIGNFVIQTTNHSPIRRYYMTRNRLNTRWKMRGLDVRPIFKPIIFESLRIILLEKQKLKKLWFVFMGVVDFLRGKYGKYE